jgi:hypothetical protein
MQLQLHPFILAFICKWYSIYAMFLMQKRKPKHVACDFNAKVCFVQADWPGAMNDLSCFREIKIYSLLLSKQLPDWMHIISDEAYSPLSVKCNHQILTPFGQHQLNTAKKEDWQNLQDWQDRATENPGLNIEKPILVTGR